MHAFSMNAKMRALELSSAYRVFATVDKCESTVWNVSSVCVEGMKNAPPGK
jgi:hypothetical protein